MSGQLTLRLDVEHRVANCCNGFQVLRLFAQLFRSPPFGRERSASAC